MNHSTVTQHPELAVAIIGLAGRFPGAASNRLIASASAGARRVKDSTIFPRLEFLNTLAREALREIASLVR